MPQSAAGWRIEPPVSVPIAQGAVPAATAAADAARGAAGHALAVPRVPHRPEAGVLGRRAHRELVQVGLAEHRRAGRRAGCATAGGRVRRAVALEDARARGARHALDAEEVLDRHRHAAQRASAARAVRLVGHPEVGAEVVARGALAPELEQLVAADELAGATRAPASAEPGARQLTSGSARTPGRPPRAGHARVSPHSGRGSSGAPRPWATLALASRDRGAAASVARAAPTSAGGRAHARGAARLASSRSAAWSIELDGSRIVRRAPAAVSAALDAPQSRQPQAVASRATCSTLIIRSDHRWRVVGAPHHGRGGRGSASRSRRRRRGRADLRGWHGRPVASVSSPGRESRSSRMATQRSGDDARGGGQGQPQARFAAAGAVGQVERPDQRRGSAPTSPSERDEQRRARSARRPPAWPRSRPYARRRRRRRGRG